MQLGSAIARQFVQTSGWHIIAMRHRSNTSIAKTVAAIKRMQENNQPSFAPQPFSNLLVVDFEATCNQYGPKPEPQEIIEFPILNISTETFEEVSRFHSYVQPDVHKELSSFCSQLTGIIQAMVDGQPTLSEVLIEVQKWLEENQLNHENSCVVTYGDWDIMSALRYQCEYHKIDVPPIFHRWINLKKCLFAYTGVWPKGLSTAVSDAGMTFKGRQHSGIDDCYNISLLLRYLANRKQVFRHNGALPPR